MDKIGKVINWGVRIFFLATFPVILVFYLRWFQLVPVISWLIFSLILLFIYGFLVRKLFVTKKTLVVKAILFLSCVVFLYLIYLDIKIHMPRVEYTAHCNGITYYISHARPFGDEQLTETHFTKWEGVFNFETFFFGYGSGPFEFVCDEENQETNIVNTYSDTLRYTDGDDPRIYVKYVGTQLGSHRYFMSRSISIPDDCDLDVVFSCDVFTYTLYECDLDYTACSRLPVVYTNGGADFLELETDESANDIYLFEEYLGSEERTLVFTYGENSRCYVDGCSIGE